MNTVYSGINYACHNCSELCVQAELLPELNAPVSVQAAKSLFSLSSAAIQDVGLQEVVRSNVLIGIHSARLEWYCTRKTTDAVTLSDQGSQPNDQQCFSSLAVPFAPFL